MGRDISDIKMLKRHSQGCRPHAHRWAHPGEVVKEKGERVSDSESVCLWVLSTHVLRAFGIFYPNSVSYTGEQWAGEGELGPRGRESRAETFR